MANDTEKELLSEIEIAKKTLKENLAKKEKEATARIDELLALKKTDFCSRCGRKVSSRLQWIGHCLNPGCENLLCNRCWIVEKSRFCKDHYKDIVGKENEGKEKVFFRSEPKPVQTTLKSDSKSDEEFKDKIEKLTASYIELLKKKIQKSVPDFTPEEFIPKTKVEVLISNDELNAIINRKSFFSKKPKLKITVKSVYGKEKSDVDFTINKVKNPDLYTILILIGDEISKEAINSLSKFSNPKLSVILVQPSQGLTYTDLKQLTKVYSKWLSDQQPDSLKDVLRSLSDDMEGRYVLTTDTVSKEFGFTESESRRLLESCDFLKPVEDTNSFFFKK